MAPTPPAPARRSDARWAVLAGLRLALAMVVVSGHLGWFVGAAMPAALRFLVSLGGTAAVLGFLVVSGYSIGHSLERRPAGFYRRRLVRIYPLYAVAVAVSVVPFVATGVDRWAGPGGLGVPRPTAGTVVGNLLLLQNVACRPLGMDPPLWTLGIEAALYVLAPWLRRWPTAGAGGVGRRVGRRVRGLSPGRVVRPRPAFTTACWWTGCRC